MASKFQYLNADLDLEFAGDITQLVNFFEKNRIFPLAPPSSPRKAARITLETARQFNNADTNVVAMLDVIEQLKGPSKKLWQGCTLREFNIGYECGEKPWAFNDGFSNKTISRIGKIGATLRVTLYPRLPRKKK